MAYEVTKVDVWATEIEDKAGELDRVLAALADAGANLECVIGRREPGKPGMGQVFVSPIADAKVKKAAKAVGLAPADMITLRIEAPNKPGKAHDIMDAISQANINVRGFSMIGLGNKAVAYVGLDSKADADKAIRAIRDIG
jgi:hypothetical protein